MLSPRTRERLTRLAHTLPSYPPPDLEPDRGVPACGLSPERSPLLRIYDPRVEGAAKPSPPGDADGSYFLARPPLTALLDGAAARALSLGAAARVLTGREDGVAVVDIETAGLGRAPLFLVGLLAVSQGELALSQWFARGTGEEAAVLEAFLRTAARFDGLVTFNGTAFDLPLILERAAHHRIPRTLVPPHLDLLPRARKQWRDHLPDCRLATLEVAICGRTRPGDIPGHAIPSLYQRFLRTGDWAAIAPIFHHNALDLLTTAELLPHLLEADGSGSGSAGQ